MVIDDDVITHRVGVTPYGRVLHDVTGWIADCGALISLRFRAFSPNIPDYPHCRKCIRAREAAEAK